MKNKKTLLLGLTTGCSIALVGTAVSLAVVLPTLNKRDYSDDVKTVNALTNIINGQNKTFNTMNDMITYLESNGIDLQKIPSAYDSQYVWDQRQNAIITIDPDGKICAAPDGYDQAKYLRNMVWKMVDLPQTSNKTIPHGVNVSTFNEYSPYGQYLRDGQAKVDHLLVTCSLDVGKNDGFTIDYNYPPSRTTTPIIKTNAHCNLNINGSIKDVDHYGKVRNVIIEDLNPEDTGAAFNEYGSVDGYMRLKKTAKAVIQPSGYVNSVGIDSDDAKLVVKKSSGKAGLVGLAVKYKGLTKSIDELVDTTGLTDTEKPELLKITYTDKILAELPFASGLGRKNAPFVIENSEQLYYATYCSNSTYLEDKIKELGFEGELTIDHNKLYFKLNNDIDWVNPLTKDNTWIPFGAGTCSPQGGESFSCYFGGGFDGNGYTIRNLGFGKTDLILKEFGFSYVNFAFFDNVEGIENKNYASHNDIWDDDKNCLKPEAIKEEYYSTVIKNLTLENVNNNVSEDVQHSTFAAGLISGSKNAYIENCHVKSGTINSKDQNVGGLINNIFSTVCKNCSIGSNDTENIFSINSQAESSVGGIVGKMYQNEYQPSNSAIVGCEVKSNVVLSINGETQGRKWTECNIGGILGCAKTNHTMSDSIIVDNCINNGIVTVPYVQLMIETGSEQDPSTYAGLGGIAGSGAGVYAFSNCCNNGILFTSNNGEQDGKVGACAGIAPVFDGNPIFVNCKNTGAIDAYVEAVDKKTNDKSIDIGMAGIVTSNNKFGQSEYKTLKLVNCTNEGQLISKNPNVKPAQIATNFRNVLFENKTFANVEEINNTLALYKADQKEDGVYVEFKNCQVLDNSGELAICDHIYSVKADNKICNSVRIESGNRVQEINIPNLNIVINKVSECKLTVSGDNCSVTVNKDAQLGKLSVTGKNSYIINNGTIGAQELGDTVISGENSFIENNGIITGTLTIGAQAIKATNNGECARVAFVDSEKSIGLTKVLINKGKIVNDESTATENNVPTIDAKDNKSKIIIENYGLIEYIAPGSNYKPLISIKHDETNFNQAQIKCYANSIVKSNREDNNGGEYFFESDKFTDGEGQVIKGIKVEVNDAAKLVKMQNGAETIITGYSQWSSEFSSNENVEIVQMQ